jgi:HEAT repeat protein
MPGLRPKFLLFTFSLCVFSILAGLDCGAPSRPPIKKSPGNVPVAKLLPQAARIIEEALADKNPYVRGNAIEVVAVTKRIRLMPKVRRLLGNEFVAPVRFAAALAVGDTRYLLAESSLKSLLSDPDENLKIAAAYALNKLGAMDKADTFNLLRKAIAGNDQTVRANAALLLGKTADRQALRLLYVALQRRDSDDKVRFQAVESIAMLGDEYIFTKLWPMVISTYADDRLIGIRAMGALGTAKAKNVLVTKLDDDVLAVRLAAAEQLGKLGDTSGEPKVLEVFRKNLTAGLNIDQAQHISVLTALAIGQIGTPRLARFLPSLLKNESIFVRIAAAKAVFQLTMRD